jgi:hypothetical protein
LYPRGVRRDFGFLFDVRSKTKVETV